MGSGGTRPQAVPETSSQQLLLSLPALRARALPQGPRSACGQSEGPAAVTTSLSPLEDGVKDNAAGSGRKLHKTSAKAPVPPRETSQWAPAAGAGGCVSAECQWRRGATIKVI